MYLPFSGLRRNPTLHLRHGLETFKREKKNSCEKQYNREIIFV